MGHHNQLYWRQKGRCFYCGRRCRDPRHDWLIVTKKHDKSSMEIEHCTPVSRPRELDEGIVGACRACNRAKNNKTVEEFRWYRKLKHRDLNLEHWADRSLWKKTPKRDWLHVYSDEFIRVLEPLVLCRWTYPLGTKLAGVDIVDCICGGRDIPK